MHLQDRMDEVGVDDPKLAGLIARDARFTVCRIISPSPDFRGNSQDPIISGDVFIRGTEKSNPALKKIR